MPDDGPFVGSELADRGFRASDRDLAALRAKGGLEPGKLALIRERGRQQLGDQIDDLSETELTSLERMLIGHDHQDINDAYRAGNRSVEQNPVVRVAASVMNKLPDFQGMIHRGLSFHSVDELEAFLNRYQPGNSVREPAFTHSAKGQNGADDFSGGRYAAGRVVLHIDARHGKDLSFMRDPAVGIDEVMHGPHTPFYPTKLEHDPETDTWHVHVRDHGRPLDLPPGERPAPIVVDRPETNNYWAQQAARQNTPPADPFGPPPQQPWSPGQPQHPYGPGQPHQQQPQYEPPRYEQPHPTPQ